MAKGDIDQHTRADQVAAVERAKYERGGISREDQLAHLSARRESSAQEMYESGRRERDLKSKGQGESEECRRAQERHRQAEAEWNGLRKEEMRLNSKSVEGPESEYRYKHDRRGNFSYSERTIHTRNGDRTVRTAQGELGNPDTTINWRSETKVGARVAQRTQRETPKSKDEDAGHMAAVQFGADPADAGNLGGQNYKQNQGGGSYHQMEARWAEEKRANPDKPIHIRIEEVSNQERYGNRAIGRTVHVDRPGNQNARDPDAFINPKSHGEGARDHKAEPGDLPGDVHDIKTGRKLDGAELARRREAVGATSSEARARESGGPSDIDAKRSTRNQTTKSKQEPRQPQERERQQAERGTEQEHRQPAQGRQQDQDRATERGASKDQAKDGSQQERKIRQLQEQSRQQEQRQRQEKEQQRQEKNRNAQQVRDQQRQERHKLDHEQKEKQRKAKEEGREKKNRNAEQKQERQSQEQRRQQRKEQQRTREKTERQQRDQQQRQQVQKRQQEQRRSRSLGAAR